MAGQRRRDSEASSLVAISQSSTGISGKSGGWKDLAGEESDESEDEEREKVASPLATSPSPLSASTTASVAATEAGLDRQHEIQPTSSEADRFRNHAQAAVAPTSVSPSSSSNHTSATPAINVVSPTPITPSATTATAPVRPRPDAHRSGSMPGSFDGSEVADDGDDANGNDAAGATLSSSPPASAGEDVWGLAARMKKFVIG